MVITAGSRTFKDVDALEKLVIHAATQYELEGYVEDFDGQEITDPEYDALFKELKKQNPKSVAFKGTSPSTAIAPTNTVAHDPPMTSIDKADGDPDEKIKLIDKWKQDCVGRVGKVTYAQSYKRDGVAIRVNYVNGILVSAGLRPRNGVDGTDVTRHAPNILGVPKKLALPLTLSLNGEVECWFSDFDAINSLRDTAGEDLYKNPRNYTAGVLGRSDAKESENARLRIALYSITGLDNWAQYYKTEIERAKWVNQEHGLNLQLRGKGFFVQMLPHIKYEQLEMMEEYAKELSYYTDGVVLKVNDLEDQEELGFHGDDNVKPPRGAIAWKYKEETAEAVVTGVEWKASRTGRVVPTALFDTPFVLADTENSRATANNYGWMKAQGLGPGATVLCKKGGKIIPNIMEVLKPVSDIGAPTHCPTCAEKLRLHTSDSGNKDLRCDNDDCGAKHIHSWIFYIQNMGGKGLGTASMELILQSGKVKSLVELYELTVDDLTEADFSEREALLALSAIFVVKVTKTMTDAELLANIDTARATKQKIEGWKFFAALGIPGAGKTVGKSLMPHFGDFRKIMFANSQKLQEVDGVGETTAEAIEHFFNGTGGEVAERLIADYVELVMPAMGKLSGTNFVLTGSFTERKQHWQLKIEALGGNIQSGVGSKTNYLVQELGKTDGSPSAKEEKAIEKGVPIISVKQLEKLL